MATRGNSPVGVRWVGRLNSAIRPRLPAWTPRQWLGAVVVAALATVWLPVGQGIWLNAMDPWWTQTMIGGCWATWREDGEMGLPAYTPVSRHAMAPSVRRAAVLSEDQRFFLHEGFDWEAIEAAWSRYQSPERSGKLRGGSTISQQVARNVFLWQGRTWARKGLEAWYTFWLEKTVPKERILDIYLNVAEMGPCTFGVEAASRRWFRKAASDLSPDEAARLVAILPAPRSRDPKGGLASRRAAWIVAQRYAIPRP